MCDRDRSPEAKRVKPVGAMAEAYVVEAERINSQANSQMVSPVSVD